MSKAFKYLREELYKISNIDFDDDINYVDNIIEFFKNINYLRLASEEEILTYFKSIFYADKNLGLKLLIFTRDKKNGLGERRIFRTILKYLGENESNILINNLNLISIYGRWDDYYSLFETPLENSVINIFKNQIKRDLSSNYPSTLGKWLKSENASSINTKALARKTRLLLGYSSKEYRNLLTDLRKKLNLIENNIRISNYRNINYRNLSPSVLIRYRKAFLRNDIENYINNTNINKIKILENIDKIFYIYNKENIKYFIENNNIGNFKKIYIKENLNNLINNEIITTIQSNGNFEDTFIINGIEKKEGDRNYKDIKVLIKLLLLYKKINLNAFKNYYMYFNKIPKFKKINEENIIFEIENLFLNYTNDNIDLNNGLDLLLFTLIKRNIKHNLIPKSVLFIYNSANQISPIKTKEILEKWLKAGYEMPKIKIWNLNNFNKDFYIENSNGYTNIYGYNKNMWKFLIEGKEINHYKILLEKFKDINYEINMI